MPRNICLFEPMYPKTCVDINYFSVTIEFKLAQCYAVITNTFELLCFLCHSYLDFYCLVGHRCTHDECTVAKQFQQDFEALQVFFVPIVWQIKFFYFQTQNGHMFHSDPDIKNYRQVYNISKRVIFVLKQFVC